MSEEKPIGYIVMSGKTGKPTQTGALCATGTTTAKLYKRKSAACAVSLALAGDRVYAVYLSQCEAI